MSAELTAALNRVLGDAHVTSRPAALAEIGVPTDSAATSWLIKPGSAAELAEVVRLANVHKVAVIPVGNQARAPKAKGLAERARVFVDIRRMNHVLHLDETSLVVHVQAGLSAVELERILAPRGLSIGDYPPAMLGSTVGGLIAVRTPGKSSTRHGFIEDAVLGVSAVMADGRTVHTRVAPRRSTGPDLARAMCGSEGTLGVITSAVLRIHRRPESRFMAAYALPGVADALASVRLALREECVPAGLRLLDSVSAELQLGGGHCEPGEAVLVVATAGPTDLAACDRDLVTSAVNAVGGRRLDDSVAETWWRELLVPSSTSDVPLPIFQVSATLGKAAAVYDAVVAAAAEAGTKAWAHASRFGASGCVLFFSLDEPAARDALETAAEAAGGYRLGARNQTLEPYFARLREQLDPNGIMNPGALR